MHPNYSLFDYAAIPEIGSETGQVLLDGNRPDPRILLSDWADKHRVLSPKDASEPGKWRTARTPYMREPMDCLSPMSETERVVLMFAAQTGKTSSGLNWLGYVVHHAPGPMMIVQPTVETAKRFSKQRVAPMIADTPVLAGMVADSRSRDSGNTILMKDFLGGVLVMTGANSAVGLRSMPVQYLFLDEVDAYPSDIEGEGDPVSLAEKRMATFPRRKILITSTPTISGASRVEREYLASDQRRYFVPCPECKEMQWLRWRGSRNDEGKEHREFRLVWSDDRHVAASYVCEYCGALIGEHHKTWMLEHGEWRATSTGRTRGYHLSGLYSPAGWRSWADIMREWNDAQMDPPRLKTFVNTVLAETWEENYSMRIDATGIAARAEMYSLLTVPEGGLVITAGVDVQDNRLEIIQRAWGEGEESWLVNYAVIHGDPGGTEVWDQLMNVIETPFMHESGKRMATRIACVDTGGHFTHAVYEFCRANKHKGVVAIKGASQHGRPALGKMSKQDVNIRGQVIKNGVDLWAVGTDTIKSVIYSRLKNTDDGPGAYHWPLGLPEQYYFQLTAEKQITKYIGGFPKRIWVKKSNDANEVIDMENYAYAALQYFYRGVNRVTIWEQLRKALNDQPKDYIPISSRTARRRGVRHAGVQVGV